MNARTAACPPKKLLTDFGQGILDDQAAETLSEHLETCADCRAEVDGVAGDSFVKRMRQAVGAKPDQSPPGPAGANMPGDESVSNAASSSETPATADVALPAALKQDTAKKDKGKKDAQALERLALPPALAESPDYEVIKALGQGGMGVVYLARNRAMDRLEVLKVVNKALLDRPGALERFQQEIRAAARLLHPNIVAALSVPRLGDLLVFAMEYVDGQDLAQFVKRRGPLPITNATFYAHQVALGLQHAHEKGMVHRDIKPGNLMLAIDGKKHVVKILDFGLAKATSEKAIDGALTKSGQMLGTPDYIAPEQALDAQRADIRADVYSLGCTLYFLLTGHAPFRGVNLMEILIAHHQTLAQPLNLARADVPAELAAIVAKMMAKDPAQRYQTPGEVATALAPFFKASAASPQPQATAHALPLPSADAVKAAPGRPRKKTMPGRRRLLPPIAIGLVLLGFIGAAAMIFKFKTADGVMVVKVNVPNPEVLVDGNRMTVTWADGGKQAEIHLPPGSRKIELKKDGFKAFGETVSIADGGHELLAATLEPIPSSPLAGDGPPVVSNVESGVKGSGTAPPLAIAPFDAKQAKAHQAAWAKHLGTKVETINSVGAKMILIPPGEFLMGSTDEQVEAALKVAEEDKPDQYTKERIQKSERPQHRVVLTKPFLMGATEVTVGQFKKFTAAAGYQTEAEKASERSTYLSPGYAVTDESPVASITWNDACAFCNWLSEQDQRTPCYRPDGSGSWIVVPRVKQTLLPPGEGGRRPDEGGAATEKSVVTSKTLTPALSQRERGNYSYRLPTEAEWEYACRAGTTTQYSFGDDYQEPVGYAWYNRNAGGKPHPVGTKSPNGFGLHDMCGNLWEWCQDFSDDTWYARSSPNDPVGPITGFNHPIRGGSWPHGVSACRSAYRNTINGPSLRSSHIGFRIVLRAEAPATTANVTTTAATATTQTPPVVAPPPVTKPTGPVPPAAKAPFDAAQAKAHQAAWAKHIGTKVETTNSIGMRMTLIPPGEFLMGSSDEQVEAAAKVADEMENRQDIKDRIETIERPQHRVVISKPFLMSATEVTVDQFRKFVEASKYVTEAEQYGFGDSGLKVLDERTTDVQKQRNWRAPGYAVTDESPVSQVTWSDACAFCNWLSERDQLAPCYRSDGLGSWIVVPRVKQTLLPPGEGGRRPDEGGAATEKSVVTSKTLTPALSQRERGNYGYRLPSEAEWEYACRAGTATQYSFGDDYQELGEYGWYNKNCGGRLPSVGLKLANAFGLHDMHGSLQEWCQDCFDEKWYEKSPLNDPTGPDLRSHHVIRGGSWQEVASSCRSAYRNNLGRSVRSAPYGFRPVRVLDAPGKTVEDNREIRSVSDRNNGFVPLFNGKDLAGWKGLTELWSVKDGTIVGTTRGGGTFNTCLCSEKKYKDFELKFQVKLTGQSGEGNSGVQIRSEVVDKDKSIVRGPQCDMGDGYWGGLWGEEFGGMMKAADPVLVNKVVKRNEFNDYYIKCAGKHVTIKLNGATMIDDDFATMPDEGVIALQLHKGPAMEVVFKNIEFAELNASTTTASVTSQLSDLAATLTRPITTFNDPAFIQWTKAVATMSADKQVEAVLKKLVELNPNFDGKVTVPTTIEAGVVRKIDFATNNVTDISPIRALAGLEILGCAGHNTGRLSDLSPLKGMKLRHLYCNYSRVSDLSPLHGMPLVSLNCEGTLISDLSPLQGMPLTNVVFGRTQVSDLSPLKGMPLTRLNIASTKVSDLSPLISMPLTIFEGPSTPVSDLSPLQGMQITIIDFTPKSITKGLDIIRQMKSLTLIRNDGTAFPPDEFWKKYDAGEFGKPPAPAKLGYLDPAFQQWMKTVAAMPADKQVEAVLKKLVELNPGFDGKVSFPPKIENGVVTAFGFFTDNVTDISPVRALPSLRILNCSGSAGGKGKLSDLSPLQGMSLWSFASPNTQISDLSALKGMRLSNLNFPGNQVVDLSPLQGMPLTKLTFQGNPVSDLSPLKGMELTELNCNGTLVSDLSPLKGMKWTPFFGPRG